MEEKLRLSEYIDNNDIEWNEIARKDAKKIVEFINSQTGQDLYKVSGCKDEREVFQSLSLWLLKFFPNELQQGLKLINYDYNKLKKNFISGLILSFSREKENVPILYDVLKENNIIEKGVEYEDGYNEIITKDFGTIGFWKARDSFIDDEETLKFIDGMGDSIKERCHEVSLFLIKKFPEFRAVTSICNKAINNKYYHSFVLDSENYVIDLTGNIIMPKDNYYMLYDVKELNDINYEEYKKECNSSVEYDESETLQPLLRMAVYRDLQKNKTLGSDGR